jgi:septal ring factor EnvC (AmiA/AmiB activator)
LTALPEVAPEGPKRVLGTRGAWILVAGVWALALAVAGTLFWVLPKAASSRDLGRQAFALRASVSEARILLDRLTAQLASIQKDLDSLESIRQGLQAEAEKNDELIASLDKRIEGLQADKAQAQAAADAAKAEFVHSGSGGVPPPLYPTEVCLVFPPPTYVSCVPVPPPG